MRRLFFIALRLSGIRKVHNVRSVAIYSRTLFKWYITGTFYLHIPYMVIGDAPKIPGAINIHSLGEIIFLAPGQASPYSQVFNYQMVHC